MEDHRTKNRRLVENASTQCLFSGPLGMLFENCVAGTSYSRKMMNQLICRLDRDSQNAANLQP